MNVFSKASLKSAIQHSTVLRLGAIRQSRPGLRLRSRPGCAQMERSSMLTPTGLKTQNFHPVKCLNIRFKHLFIIIVHC